MESLSFDTPPRPVCYARVCIGETFGLLCGGKSGKGGELAMERERAESVVAASPVQGEGGA